MKRCRICDDKYYDYRLLVRIIHPNEDICQLCEEKIVENLDEMRAGDVDKDDETEDTSIDQE